MGRGFVAKVLHHCHSLPPRYGAPGAKESVVKVDERPQLELIIYLLDAWLLSHRFNFLSYPGGDSCCCFRNQGGLGCSVAFLLGKR